MKARTSGVVAFAMGTVLGIATVGLSSPPCEMGQSSSLTITSVKRNGAPATIPATAGLGLSANPDGASSHLAANVLDPDTQMPRHLVLEKIQ
jgi:hypothetical protein